MKPSNELRIITILTLATLALLIAPLASAGTLTSGTTVELDSNYAGLQGDWLLLGWSNTPSVNDELIINEAVLPEGFKATGQSRVVFEKPTYEQIFRVTDQTRLLRLNLHHERFNYLAFTNAGAQADCQSSLDEHLTSMGNPELLNEFSTPMRVTKLYCEALFITVQQEGWVGDVQYDRVFFKQDILIDGQRLLSLERSENRNQLTDTAPGVARATLTGFNQYTSAPLTSSNVAAYHNRNSLGSGDWNAFTGVSTLNSYQNQLAVFGALTDRWWNGQIESDSLRQEAQAAVFEVNDLAARMKSQSNNLPSEWNQRISAQPRTFDNNIAVQPRTDTISAEIQLIINGARFGLYVPTGECSVQSVDSTGWLETEQGRVSYEVRNTGSDSATFGVSATCSGGLGGSVSSFPRQINVAEGASYSDRLVMTGKTDTLENQENFNCVFTCREVNTGQEDTASFSVALERKQLCAEGEQTAPRISEDGGLWTVDVLDAECRVKQQLTCNARTSQFVQQNGQWVCEDRDDVSGTPPPSDEGAGSFSVGLFWTALILGLFGAGASLYFTTPIAGLFRGSGFLRGVIAVSVFIIVFIGVALIVSSIISLFTITTPSLSFGLFG